MSTTRYPTHRARRHGFSPLVTAAFSLLTVCFAPTLPAQDSLTAADYDRAVRMLSFNVNPLVVGGTVGATWLPDDRFYFRNTTPTGSEWILVDPVKRVRTLLFDATALATALTRAGAGSQRDSITARDIPARHVRVVGDGRAVSVVVLELGDGRSWRCDLMRYTCTPEAEPTPSGRASPPVVVSPDGRSAAFIRNWNLWVRNVATGAERQLTTDGAPNFGYATDNAGWVHSDRPILKWSPDSRRIATQQQDDRNVGDMYLVDTRVGHPHLEAWKYPLPGDSVVSMIQRVIIDVDSGRVVRLRTPPDYHRAMLGDDLDMNDLIWSPDASRLAYVSTSRDHKSATVHVADAATGVVRTVFQETSPTQFESVAGWNVIWPAGEIIWSSERDNWSQLYAYDLDTGKLLRRITTGDGPVVGIAHVDDRARTLVVGAMGRTSGEDPYFRHYYSVGLNGRGWTPLTPEPADHSLQISPSGHYLIDSYSTPQIPPTVVLRDVSGRVLMQLAHADISRLLEVGWKPPVSIVTTARDGHTRLYGLMFRPTNFDSTRKYPIINNPYPGPQAGSVGPRSFIAARGDRQALAELGFVVITVDGMGTPGRSKSFHDAYYGAMGRDNTIPDQVAAMKEVAARYPWVDVSRAGIYGHSGGGFITADAMFRYPDFFKAGIAESGNHDQRNYEDDWGERYQGLLLRNGSDSDSYAIEANQNIARNLEGHLLLAHGSMDDNVPPSNTDLVASALIRANKDFDELIIPNARHGYGSASNYMMRRRWDYFVRYLLGKKPPREYDIKPPAEQRGARR